MRHVGLFLVGIIAARAHAGELELVPQVGHDKTYFNGTAAFTADGARVVTAGGRDLKVWDAHTGMLLRSIKTDGMKLALEPGDMRAWVVGQGTAVEYDLRTGDEVTRTKLPKEIPWALSVALLPDGHRAVLAVSGAAPVVAVVDLRSGAIERRFDGAVKPDKADQTFFNPYVAVTSDGKTIAAALQTSPKLRFFDVDTGALIREQTVPPISAIAAGVGAVSILTQDFATGGKIELSRVDVASGARSAATVVGAGAQLSPDGRFVVLPVAFDPLTGRASKIDVVEVATGRGIARVERPFDYSTKQFMSPRGDAMLLDSAIDPQANVVSGPRRLEVIALRDGKALFALGGVAMEVNDASFTPDGSVLVGALTDAELWDPATGATTRRFDPAALGGLVRLTGDGARISVAHMNPLKPEESSSRFIDPRTGQDLAAVHGALTEQWAAFAMYMPNRLSFTLDKQDPISHGWTFNVVDTSAGRIVGTYAGLRGGPGGVAISPDESLVVAGSYEVSETNAYIWRIAQPTTPPIVLTGAASAVQACAFTKDSARVVVAGTDTIARVYETATGRLVSTMKGHTGPIYGVTFLPDGKSAITWGADGDVRRFDVESGEPRDVLAAFPGGVARVTVLDEGRTLVASGITTTRVVDLANPKAKGLTLDGIAGIRPRSPDGRLYLTRRSGGVGLWDAKTGKLLVTRTMGTGGEWLAAVPGGQFDISSPRAKELVAWRVGDDVVGADQFFEKAYTPGVFALATSGAAPAALKDVAPPPLVRLVPLKQPLKPGEETDVVVEVKDGGGGVGEVRLYHAGRLVSTVTNERGFKRSTTSSRKDGWVAVPFKVVLLAGDNALRASAFSTGGVESAPAEANVNVAGAKATAALWALAVGINNYEVDDMHLRVSRDDADAIATALEHGSHALFSSVNVKRVLDREATRQGILDAIGVIAAHAKPEDVVVLFLSGHGDTDPDSGRYSFLPADFRFKNMASLESAGISQEALGKAIAGIQARKLLVLLDTCKSGKAAKALGGMLALRGIGEQRALAVLARASGVAVAAASTDTQSALEDTGLGHGIFTHVLLLTLGAPKGPVTVAKLLSDVEETVPKLTEQKYGRLQDPIVARAGQDFPIVAP